MKPFGYFWAITKLKKYSPILETQKKTSIFNYRDKLYRSAFSQDTLSHIHIEFKGPDDNTRGPAGS